MTARIRHLPARSKAGWTLPAWTVLLGLLFVVDAPPVGAQLQIERTLFVSATGSPEQNCTALRAALDGIPDPRNQNNRYFVEVGPGLYDCGTNTITVPGYVAVEGAGVNATVILGYPNSLVYGIVDFDRAPLSELRSMTVSHFGGTSNAVAVSVYASFGVDLRNVVVAAPSGPSSNVALWVGSGANPGENSSVQVLGSEVFAATAAKTNDPATRGAGIQFWYTRIGGDLDTSAGGSIQCGLSTSGFQLRKPDCTPP